MAPVFAVVHPVPDLASFMFFLFSFSQQAALLDRMRVLPDGAFITEEEWEVRHNNNINRHNNYNRRDQHNETTTITATTTLPPPT